MPGTPTFRVFAGVGLKPEGERCVEGSEHAPEDCPDLDDDRDGIKNSRDLCPLEPEDLDRFDDHDGCPDPDNDNDGVLDDDDKCPRQFGPKETQGCPAEGADRDGDGTRDLLDNCPDAAGPASNQGCPESEKQLVVITVEKLVIKERVYFETAKSNILSVSYPLLDQVSRVLREHPEIELVTVEGHTDDRGGAEYNQGLSMDRASSVKRYLEGKGIDPARLKAAGYGLTRPADTNATEEGRAANRRVEFIIDRSR
jgi:outer membrane protein OmpA-like peptidoglycan-associated protein